MYMYMYTHDTCQCMHMYIPFIYTLGSISLVAEGLGLSVDLLEVAEELGSAVELLEVAVGLGLVVELLAVHVAVWLGSLGGLSFGGGEATSRTKEFLDCFGLFLLAPDFFLGRGSEAVLAALFLDFLCSLCSSSHQCFCVYSVHRVLIITTMLPFFFSH